MRLTPSQSNAVDQLINAFVDKNEVKIIDFKAPTGSGKTFMASEFISRVFASQIARNKKTVFVVATVSNAKLPEQFAKKLEDYKEFHAFSDYEIDYIQSPSASKSNKQEDAKDFILGENKVFVFGTSSFGTNTIFHQNRTLETFLSQAQFFGYEIIFIRDEAHIGQKEKISKSELKTFDHKMNNSASFVINMTATPRSKYNLIEMKPSDMQKDGFYLLKTNMNKTKLSDEVTNAEIIDDAIKTFKKVKTDYHSLEGVVINPAMLIQLMNDSDYKKDPIRNELYEEGLKLVEEKLQAAGLKYLKYLSGKHEVIGTNVPATLDYASQNDSEIDVIIFKVGPATGWDIPRANMLLQLRNVSSESLNIQTLGRIIRNPYPGLSNNEVTKKYYVWSNYQKPTREETFYKIKDKFQGMTFISGKINEYSRNVVNDNKDYSGKVIEFLDSKEFLNRVRDIRPSEIIYNSIDYGSAKVVNPIPNYIYLKIFNRGFSLDNEESLKISIFEKELWKVAESLGRDIEIVKYVLSENIAKLNEIKSSSADWVSRFEPYEIVKGTKTLSSYSLWKDNKTPKAVNTSGFKNYGYEQISEHEEMQYLDSTPELMFYKNFEAHTSKKQKDEIDFIAKMPTLGSQVYFEYFSKLKGKISKSYMDFAIKYKDKIIMVEVKSRDQDYSEEKTKELLSAYKIYMDKFKDENLNLVLYQYDKETKSNFLHGYMDGMWEEDVDFSEFFNYLLK